MDPLAGCNRMSDSLQRSPCSPYRGARSYLLDRELSETELTFRSFEDYVSKYRRVLDYFAAVKIGLTATPALHTTEIFGAPVYT